MEETYYPLFSEILDRVHKAKTKDKKIDILRQYKTDALKMFLKAGFDPNIQWVFPDGAVPYTPNDAPAGTNHTVLIQETKKLWHFIKGADNVTRQAQKETMFFQMLEGLHESEAKLLVNAKDKKLHQIYKGLSANVVREAFGWNEDFKVDEYPQAGRSASGLVDGQMRVTPIQRTVFSQRRQSQTWKVSDSPDSQTDEYCPGAELKKPNENKDLKRHLTLPQSSVIFIK